MRKRNDRRQQSLRWSDKRWLDTMRNEGTGTVRIRRTTAGPVRICNVGRKIRNGPDETDCGGRTADSSDKNRQRKVAESVTMPENIKLME